MERQGRSDLESSLNMKSALAVRRKVMLLLEQARENKSVLFYLFPRPLTTAFRQLRNSLEAGIDLLLPSQGDTAWRELDVLRHDRTSFPVHC